jgi:hypothetical protein
VCARSPAIKSRGFHSPTVPLEALKNRGRLGRAPPLRPRRLRGGPSVALTTTGGAP